MIIIEVLRQGFPEVPGAQNDKMVQTLPANGTDEALSVRVLPRALRRGEHLCHAQCGDLGTDFDSVNAIPVAGKESGCVAIGRGFDCEPQRPPLVCPDLVVRQ